MQELSGSANAREGHQARLQGFGCGEAGSGLAHQAERVRERRVRVDERRRCARPRQYNYRELSRRCEVVKKVPENVLQGARGGAQLGLVLHRDCV